MGMRKGKNRGMTKNDKSWCLVLPGTVHGSWRERTCEAHTNVLQYELQPLALNKQCRPVLCSCFVIPRLLPHFRETSDRADLSRSPDSVARALCHSVASESLLSDVSGVS
jgi:hypothetical protein